MATTYENLGPIYITTAKFLALKQAGTLEAGREYKLTDWEAQEKLLTGVGISIAADGKTLSFDNTVLKFQSDTQVATKISTEIGKLDKLDISGFGKGKTLLTLKEENGIISATFQNIEVAESQVTNLVEDLADLENAIDSALEEAKEYTETYAEPKDDTILKQADVVDNLTSTSTIAPLSANQGKALNEKIGYNELTITIAQFEPSEIHDLTEQQQSILQNSQRIKLMVVAYPDFSLFLSRAYETSTLVAYSSAPQLNDDGEIDTSVENKIYTYLPAQNKVKITINAVTAVDNSLEI